jgi:hypothetical protein
MILKMILMKIKRVKLCGIKIKELNLERGGHDARRGVNVDGDGVGRIGRSGCSAAVGCHGPHKTRCHLGHLKSGHSNVERRPPCALVVDVQRVGRLRPFSRRFPFRFGLFFNNFT